MLFGFLILLGGISLTKLEISLFPEIIFPRLTVITMMADAPPDEIENLITKPVEYAVSSVQGVQKIRSRSEEGFSSIEIQLDWNSSPDLSIIQLRQKLDRIKYTLPEEAQKSVIIRYDPAAEPAVLISAESVQGEYNNLRDDLEKNVIPLFERIDGAAGIFLSGGTQREISVNLDLQKMQENKISIDQVSNALASANFDYPAGNIENGIYEHSVRFSGNFKSISDIGNIPAGYGTDGSPVFVNQIAEIIDGLKERTSSTLLNGEPAVLIGIRNDPGKNLIRTADNVSRSLHQIQQEFQSIKFSIINDASVPVRHSIDSVRNSAVLGAFFSFFILLIFLKNIQSSFIIAISIPVSVIITFFFMHVSGISINIMSLGGLALGTGMLVDSAIVTLESIFREISLHPNKNKIQNINRAVSGVSHSLTGSALTSAVIFLPVIFLPGLPGVIFKDLALTVSFALAVSLFSSQTLIPVLACLELPWLKFPFMKKFRLFQSACGAAESLIFYADHFYAKLLAFSFKHKRFIPLLYLLLASASILMFPFLKISLFQEQDTGILISEFELPDGAPLIESESFHRDLNRLLISRGLIQKSITKIGYDAESAESLIQDAKRKNISRTVFFVNTDIVSSREFIRQVSAAVSSFRGIKKSFQIKKDELQNLIGESDRRYRILIECNNREAARKKTEELLRNIKRQPGIVSIRSSVLSKDPEIQVSFHKEKLMHFSLYPSDIGSLIHKAFAGTVASKFKQQEREIDIRVRLKNEDRNKPEQIRELLVQNRNGISVPLRDLIEVKQGNAFSGLYRENQKLLEYISFETADEGRFGDSLKKIRSIVDNQNNQSKINPISVKLLKENSETLLSISSLGFSLLLSLILIYQILAAQFESLIHPLSAVISSIAFLPGAFLFLILTGNGINLSSATGLILLSGISVNISIILYERIKQNLEKQDVQAVQCIDQYGKILKQCIYSAVRERIRPILLTGMTTLAGMIPLLVSLDENTSPQKSLASAVTGGIFFSTLFSPAVFAFFFYAIELKFFRLMAGLKRKA